MKCVDNSLLQTIPSVSQVTVRMTSTNVSWAKAGDAITAFQITNARVDDSIAFVPSSQSSGIRLRCRVRVRVEPCIRNIYRSEVIEHPVDASYIDSHVDIGTRFGAAPVKAFYVKNRFRNCRLNDACGVVNTKRPIGKSADTRMCECCHYRCRTRSRNSIRGLDQ